MGGYTELQFSWSFLGLQPCKATVFRFLNLVVKKKRGSKKGPGLPRQQAFLRKANNHKIMSLYLFHSHSYSSLEGGGGYKQNGRLARGGSCLSACLLACLFNILLFLWMIYLAGCSKWLLLCQATSTSDSCQLGPQAITSLLKMNSLSSSQCL